jgi:DNA-binding NarL/FixJ family response regulator
MNGKTVAIVEDNASFRESLRIALESNLQFNNVETYSNAESFLSQIHHKNYDIILMDLSLPGIGGIETVKKLKSEIADIKIIIITLHDDDDHIFKGICSGASGYLTKPILPENLFTAIDDVFAGGSPLSPNIAKRVIQLFNQYAPKEQKNYGLSEREKDVLSLLVEGLELKEIASSLNLSIYTIRAHVRNIYEKLHVHSKSQAVAKALTEGLI